MTTQNVPRCPACGNELEGPLPTSTGQGPIRCAKQYCGVELLPTGDDRFRVRTFRLVNHYSLLVLPFAFAGGEGHDPIASLIASDRWTSRTFSLDDPDDTERTEYFLPYVKRFLFPSLYPPRPGIEPTCRHFDFRLDRLGTPVDGSLSLTLECRDTRKSLEFRHALRLARVHLVVFNYRVGFLVLDVRSADEGATYFDQMNAVVHLRAIAPLYRGFEMPTLVVGEGRFGSRQLLPWLLGEFGPARPPAAPGDLPADVALPVQPIYDDRMMTYSYSCVDKDTCLDDPVRCQALLDRFAVVNFDEVTTAPDSDAAEVAEWVRGRWQGFSKEGGSLAVFDTDRFHERFLGLYNASYYFDIFLLATLQRVTLLSLFERLSDIPSLVTGGAESRRLLRRVRRDLLLFKNQCWFSQITNRERGLDLWKRWQAVFENRALLEEVNEQSEELESYLQGRTREKIEWLVRLGGFLAATVPGVLGLEVLFGQRPWVSQVRWILLVALVVGTGLFAAFVFFRDREE